MRTRLVFDTKGLAIASVNDQAGEPLTFQLGPVDPLLGQALTVSLRPASTAVTIHYTTSPDAGALQWLSPAQTAGNVHPYLFSQGESIYTRTWVPTQDSPGIRQTYRARIVVPAPLTAVMSAEMLTPSGVPTADGRAFEFKLDRPIPPYLIALAVGDIAFRPLGRRTGVYAEPSAWSSAAAYEFADLEKMLEAAEASSGPYRWGRYDIIVLPPSFPYRRDGESAPDVRVADRARRGSLADVVGRARARALLVRQPRHQRHVARLLAERRVHDVLREADHGVALRPEARAMLQATSTGRNRI